MSRFFVFLFVVTSVIACSNDTDPVNNNPVLLPTDGDTILPHEQFNTGKLLSIDGGNLHIAYTYDEQGRVVGYEKNDSSNGMMVKKNQASYEYGDNRIFVKSHEFEEWPEGVVHNSERNVMKYDTLFMVNNRVDSCAGVLEGGTCFFYKFEYDNQGRLISLKNDNVLRDNMGRLRETPLYSEFYTLEWENGNVVKKKVVIPTRGETSEWNYNYSSLKGSFTLSDVRVFVFDLEPLFAEGYFGVSCTNLLLSVESSTERGNKTYKTKCDYEYELDSLQMIKVLRETWSNQVRSSTGEFKIKWK